MLVGVRKEPVRLQESHLEFVPGTLIVHHTICLELLEKFVADLEEIRPAQVVEIGITKDPLQLVARRLGHLGGHDHPAYGLHLCLGVAELRQMPAGDVATHPLVLKVLFGEAHIVEECCGLQQGQSLTVHTLGKSDINDRSIHVQGVLEAMVRALGRKLLPQLLQDEHTRALVVHADGAKISN